MGTVVISIDAELAWGFHDLPDPPENRISRSRWGWSQLRELCESYSIPATWAIVGHLFLEHCDGYHHDHPLGAGWFERERTDWADARELRFGTDLIGTLTESDVAHDIGCHTFSHVEFGSEQATQAVAREELALFTAATGAYDLPFTSFIFPRNNIGNRDVVAEWGFSCYRGTQPRRGRNGPVSRPLAKLSQATVSAPPLVQPTVDEYGLINIPASLYLFGFEGRFRRLAESIWADPVVKQAHHGIEQAAQTDEIFHMWLHPNNITDEADVRRLEAIWSTLDRERRADRVEIKTMREVAQAVDADRSKAVSTPVE